MIHNILYIPISPLKTLLLVCNYMAPKKCKRFRPLLPTNICLTLLIVLHFWMRSRTSSGGLIQQQLDEPLTDSLPILFILFMDYSVGELLLWAHVHSDFMTATLCVFISSDSVLITHLSIMLSLIRMLNMWKYLLSIYIQFVDVQSLERTLSAF